MSVKKEKLLKKPSDFKVGYIYKMNVGARSHVKTSYFVQVVKVCSHYIITNIPNYYSVKIYYGNNWDYHIGRFEKIGKYREFKNLLHNQIGLVR